MAGNIIYADDFNMDGMLYAKVFRSTRASAKIKSLDISIAQNLPGVFTIITAQDVPNNHAVTGSVGQMADLGLAQTVPQLVLAEDRVRFYGEPIALVAAEDPDIAEAALKLIRIEYEDLPGVFDPEEAMKDNSPKVLGDTNIVAHWELRRGDVDSALEKPT